MTAIDVAFVDALDAEARPRFTDRAKLAADLGALRAAACSEYPDIVIAATTFATELARRLGPNATPDEIARVKGDHVHLAIACAAGNEVAIKRFEATFLDEVEASAKRMLATRDQADDVRSHMRRILFVSEAGRPAALLAYSGRAGLRTYLRVIATRELVRVIGKDRREVPAGDSFLDRLSPAAGVSVLRDKYRADVDDAIRTALADLPEEPRALLRYSVIDGWSIDRIAALFNVHRTTAHRRVAAAREQLGDAIRAQLSARLAISITEVDSIIRQVQSRIDVSLERMLA